jgi:hypothetical protein
LSLLDGVRYCTPVTIYLPVPQHLAHVAWIKVQQVALARLMAESGHRRVEAVRRMARLAVIEPVVALTVDTVPVKGMSLVQVMTFERRHGDGPLLPGVHGSGHPGSTVLAVGVGPAPAAARADLIARLDVLLRPEGSAPTETLTLAPRS